MSMTPAWPATASPRGRARVRWGLALLACLGLTSQSLGDDLQYNRDIRPILAENCFACHGPDSASRKANLRLDQRDAAVSAKAIAPTKPDESELLARIVSDDPEEVMPPPSTKKTLTAAQKATVRRWIQDGAKYEAHWSLHAPKRPEPPKVKDASWVKTPIDAFLLANLERKGLTPAPEADRRTLARRLSLDLIGLPPEPAMVEAFVKDRSPKAYEALVDKLLASPRYGEHRARYWLDAARYADTHGLHFDNFREMWTYRDWVINAFNRNLPFSQFTIEQLAGDLLPNPTLDQRIASGFNRCNITTNEGGTILEENLVLYTRDRTETFGAVFLGTTVNCTVCHDHKFDPLSQKEFYKLSAFFNNFTAGALDGNIKDTPPIIFVPAEADQARWTKLEGELNVARKAISDRASAARKDFDTWLAAAKPEAIAATLPAAQYEFQLSSAWTDADGIVAAPGVSIQSREAGDFENNQPFTVSAWAKLPKGDGGAILARMDDKHDFRGWDLWVERGRLGTHIVNKWPENALKVLTEKPVMKPDEWIHVVMAYDGSKKVSGVKFYVNGDLQSNRTANDTLTGTIKTHAPLTLFQRLSTSRIDGLRVFDVRLSKGVQPPSTIAQTLYATRAARLAATAKDKRKADEVNAVFDLWRQTSDPATKEFRNKLLTLEGEEQAIRARGSIAHVSQEKPEPAVAYVLFRGEYDKRRDKVTPGTPSMLPPMSPDMPKNRLGLAQWLLKPEHPLMARVTVNRFWQELFGVGLVKTAGDFGVAGELPAHPELLDWLAVDFRESGWDTKRFFKQLVMSSAYRQAAVATLEKPQKDPQNLDLSRGPRFRMDAEMVRDYALAVSGLLAARVGGPSARPYQPDGVWEAVAMPESNTRIYRRDEGEGLYRRSMYTFWKRAAPPASMETFNAPSRETCTVRRERTNTPLQALVTLNDPQFVEAARNLAERTLRAEESTEARLDLLARKLLARPWREEEKSVVERSIEDLLAHYKAHPDDAAKLDSFGASKPDDKLDRVALAAWTMLANELLNLDEVLNK